MIIDVLVVSAFMLLFMLVLHIYDMGKLMIASILTYVAVRYVLVLNGARGNDLWTMIKSKEIYHDEEIKKLF